MPAKTVTLKVTATDAKLIQRALTSYASRTAASEKDGCDRLHGYVETVVRAG